MKKTDLEIIDELLAKRVEPATEGPERDVRDDRGQFWAGVLRDLEPLRAQEKQLGENVLANLARQVESSAQPRVARRVHLRVGLAAAACIALVAGIAGFITYPLLSRDDLHVQHARNGVHADVFYVDFGREQQGRGTAQQPYATLERAVAALPDKPSVIRLSGTVSGERLRIERPVRLEASGAIIGAGAVGAPPQSPQPTTSDQE